MTIVLTLFGDIAHRAWPGSPIGAVREIGQIKLFYNTVPTELPITVIMGGAGHAGQMPESFCLRVR